jgi:hypothetical protein
VKRRVLLKAGGEFVVLEGSKSEAQTQPQEVFRLKLGATVLWRSQPASRLPGSPSCHV